MDHRPQHPLYILELLDRCLDFLDPASGDLCSCALVARLWVYPAHARLFRAPFTTNKLFSFRDSTALKFHDSLLNNPHLLPLVRELTFKWMNHLTPGVFTQICRLNFTNLEYLTIEPDGFGPRDTICQGIWDLTNASETLRSLALNLGSAFGFPVSMSILDNASRSIEHFDLFCVDWSSEDFVSPSARALADSIYLTSIRLMLRWDRPKSDEFTLPMFYPFDLSKLRAISVSGKGSFPWNALPKGSIEVLAFTPGQHEEEISDLSLLPKLTVLRASTDYDIGELPLCRLLATIKAGHQIQTIVIYVDPGAIKWAELDLALSSLPHPLPVIELEFHPSQTIPDVETLWIYFPTILPRMSPMVMFLRKLNPRGIDRDSRFAVSIGPMRGESGGGKYVSLSENSRTDLNSVV
ncbi:hypothetical protein R3P38DRAFT_2511887 [Favolaschia claudopus]|uniref:F-box domain-containing protein n=1 Tax=Favolaschia claudopus TaxID=2862362 RepID=A0AAW0CX17_9AGAR